MNKKHRPTKDQFEKFDLSNACSATECTGLVTHFASEEELEAYMDVYNFQATPCPDKPEEKENKI